MTVLHWHIITLFIGWFLFIPAVLVYGAEPLPPVSQPNPLLPKSISQVLGLDSFIERVERYHPALKIADFDRRMVSAKRLEKQGAFDPAINAAGSFSRFNSSSAEGQVQNVIESQYTLDFLTRYGLQFSGGGKIASGDVKTPVSPTGDTGEYFVGVKVPLLRNAGINEKSAAERKAILGESVADATFRQKRLALLLKGVESYWRWVAGQQKLAIEQELIGIARFRQTALKERADLGDVAQITVVEAQREVQKRQGRLVKATRNLQKTTFDVSLFLWDVDGSATEQPDPDENPGEIPKPLPVSADWESEGKIKALKLRPELKALSISKDIARVDYKLAKNQFLPQLDAYLNQGYEAGHNGIGPVIKTGLQLNVPLRYRTAKGQVRQAKLSLKKLNVQEKQLIQQVFVQVQDAVSALETAFARYEAAVQEVAFAQQLTEGERTKFDYGDSTLFLVNRRERAAAEAQISLVDTLLDYQQALVRFYAVTGQL